MWQVKKQQIVCSLWPLKLEKEREYIPCYWLHLICNDTLTFWSHMYTICCSHSCLFHSIISSTYTLSCTPLCRPPPPSFPSFLSCFIIHIWLSTLSISSLHFALAHLLNSPLSCCLPSLILSSSKWFLNFSILTLFWRTFSVLIVV